MSLLLLFANAVHQGHLDLGATSTVTVTGVRSSTGTASDIAASSALTIVAGRLAEGSFDVASTANDVTAGTGIKIGKGSVPFNDTADLAGGGASGPRGGPADATAVASINPPGMHQGQGQCATGNVSSSVQNATGTGAHASTVDLPGTGTLITGGDVGRNATDDLPVAATLTASGAHTAAGTAAVTVAVTQLAATGVHTAAGSGDLSGDSTGALGAGGQYWQGSADILATSDVYLPLAGITFHGGVDVPAAATLDAQDTTDRAGNGTAPAANTVVTPYGGKAGDGTADVPGTGSLVSVGYFGRTGPADVSGTGTGLGVGDKVASGTAAFTAVAIGAGIGVKHAHGPGAEAATAVIGLPGFTARIGSADSTPAAGDVAVAGHPGTRSRQLAATGAG